jgi:hypothetical protein
MISRQASTIAIRVRSFWLTRPVCSLAALIMHLPYPACLVPS